MGDLIERLRNAADKAEQTTDAEDDADCTFLPFTIASMRAMLNEAADAIEHAHAFRAQRPVVVDGDMLARAGWLLDSMAWQGDSSSMSFDDAGSLHVWAQDAAAVLKQIAALEGR